MAIPGRDTLTGKLLRLPLDALPQVPLWVMSGPLRGKRWIAKVANHGYLVGTFEREKQESFAAEIRQEAVVFDLGAHVGFYSLLASAKGASVVAVEPDPTNAGFVRRHLDLNGYRGEVVEAAVAQSVGNSYLVEGSSSSTGHLGNHGRRVDTLSLDSLSETYGYPDVVKMDIEGSEVEALLGGTKTLERARVLFIATHGDRLRDRCEKILGEAGYEVDRLQDPLELVARNRNPNWACIRPGGRRR